MDDVALRKVSRETNYYKDFVRYPKYKFFACPHPQYVLIMFLNFGHFSVLLLILMKKVLSKKECIASNTTIKVQSIYLPTHLKAVSLIHKNSQRQMKCLKYDSPYISFPNFRFQVIPGTLTCYEHH